MIIYVCKNKVIDFITLDNHDPPRLGVVYKMPAAALNQSQKGGCVLLNDGTVKFIRTHVLSLSKEKKNSMPSAGSK